MRNILRLEINRCNPLMNYLGNELLLFSSGASEELRCWKVEVGLARDQSGIKPCKS